MEESSPLTTSASSDSGQKPAKRKAWQKILFFVVVFLLLGGIGYAAMSHFLGGNKKVVEGVETTPTPTIEETPTDTPTPEVSDTPAPTQAQTTDTPTPRPTTNPIDTTSGLDRRELSIEVQNGSGEAGVAGKMADFLKSFGYKISGTANADNFDHTNISISVKSDSANYLPLLKKDLSSQYTVGDTDTNASSSADAVVIVGK